MGWFSDVVDFGESLFSADKIIPTLATIGATIYSASESSDANSEAARLAKESADKQAAAIAAGNQQAQQRFDQIQATGQPGIDYLQGVIASPGTLTPFQKQQLDEARLRATNQVSRSGLRGSGRATTAAIKSVESDLTNRFLQSNQDQARAAAGTLATPALNAPAQAAAYDASTGRAVGQAAVTSGANQGQADIANASLRGSAVGDIASLIASDVKGRDSRYSERQKKQENQSSAISSTNDEKGLG